MGRTPDRRRAHAIGPPLDVRHASGPTDGESIRAASRRIPEVVGLRSVRVLTVDDHATFRGAARALIGATDGFEVAGEASTGEEGVAAACRLHPDMVLMDVRLPDIDGYEATRRITPTQPDTVVVLMSAADEAIQGDTAARCGAAAFVRKQDLRPALLQQLWSRHASHVADAG